QQHLAVDRDDRPSRTRRGLCAWRGCRRRGDCNPRGLVKGAKHRHPEAYSPKDLASRTIFGSRDPSRSTAQHDGELSTAQDDNWSAFIASTNTVTWLRRD